MNSEKPEQQPKKQATGSQETNLAPYCIHFGPFDEIITIMYADRKLSEARSALLDECLRQGTKLALNEVIDAAIKLGLQAGLSPHSRELFFVIKQSQRGKKSSEARAKKGRWWVPRASRLISELWRTRKSEPAIAADVSLKLSDEEGRTVSEKTLLRHIQSMKKAGALEPRRNTKANKSKQPASRPDSA